MSTRPGSTSDAIEVSTGAARDEPEDDRRDGDARDGAPQVVLLTGLSGGGKTAAAKLFEDLAFTVVDNLPVELLPTLAELVAADPERFAHVAIVVDVRSGDVESAYRAARGALEGRGIRPQVFFLEASDEALIRRFSETRHRHPLSDGRGMQRAIQLERRMLDPIRAEADVVLDTSELPLRDLRERLFVRLGEAEPGKMSIQLISFGYKFGVPLEADLVFDTRFLQNPYYVPELRDHSGLTPPVRDYVMSQPRAREFLDHVQDFLTFGIPAFVAEGKSRLTIGIGCTGGRHRSIVLAEQLAAWLREQGHGPVEVFHRELERG